MRGRTDDRKSYAKPVGIGEVMSGESVCEVIASDRPDYAAGDIVLAPTGWAHACAAPPWLMWWQNPILAYQTLRSCRYGVESDGWLVLGADLGGGESRNASFPRTARRALCP
jgi:N-terminal domain of oxidoreductase